MARHRLLAAFGVLAAVIGLSPLLAGASPEAQKGLRTLRTLVSCGFDRAATSAQLHVHRNTLSYRLGRIEEITGLDLDSPRDAATVYLAIAVAPE